jgi:hypothetical protein
LNLQGAPATAEGLATSEVGYLTYVYCLMSQPDPKDEHYRPVDVNHSIPPGMKDRDTEDWLGEVPICRAILRGVFEGQIASLRQREALLRKSHEDPSRAGAETRSEGLEGPLGRHLDRQAQMHDQSYLRAYNALIRGRKETARTGRAPGVLKPDLRATLGGRVNWQTAPAAEPPTPRGSPAQRTAEADALAPRETNGVGIGSPTGQGDDFMAATIAARTAAGPGGLEQERDQEQEQEQEQDRTSPKPMATAPLPNSDPDLAPPLAPDPDPNTNPDPSPNPHLLPIRPLS